MSKNMETLFKGSKDKIWNLDGSQKPLVLYDKSKIELKTG